MKILLTGPTGQVGYELERSLQGLGQIVALDRSQMDLTDNDQIRASIQRIQPDLIINPAAYTAVDKAESDSDLALQINGTAPGVMAEEAKKLGAAMIHFSTDYVFDGSKASAYAETDLPNPQNVYGSSKLAGELAVQAAGIPHLILRTSWVYGARGNNFLLTVRRLAQQRDELRIVADQHGSPTWCRTIADSTAHIVAQLVRERGGLQQALQPLSGVYHLTAQGHTTWHGFTEAIVAHASIPKKPRVTAITTADYPLPAKRPGNSVLSCQRFLDTFGDLPQWEHALRLCME